MEYINTIKDYHKTYIFYNLSLFIDKYLVSHNNKKNAEVYTPSFLRKEMLNEFWKTPKKVFEPCFCKAGFLIEDKFEYIY